MSSGFTKCKECRAAIPDGSPGGLCGRCLFALGLQHPQTMPDATASELAAASLLQGDQQAAPLAEPLPEALDASKAADRIVPRTEKRGDRIGRYKLLEPLGEGGMGSVWVAEQTEPVRRVVALKVIKPGMDSAEVLARFEAERQALALMDHPNIAKVLEAGTTSEGRPYFVMELVKGIPFMRFCDEQRLSVRERLELFMQVCQAIQHAHQKGIIHRDLKPSNVLVALYDGKPVPKVIDFGVAKAMGQRLTDRTLYTQLGKVVGTLAYMSPEQSELNQLDIDTRSDIYSLGVLLYELLTGTTPLIRESLHKAAFDEVLRRIREEEPPKPSLRLSTSRERLPAISAQRKLEPEKLTKLIRGELDWIVMKALEKDRQRRYETANGFARDIERHLKNEPVIACPPSSAYRMHKFIRRNRLIVTSVALVVTALALGVALSTWEAIKARRAEREQSRLREDAQRANANAIEALRDSYLAQARARRLTSESGRRFDSFDVLTKAAAIRPSLELRNEAIACMTLADIRFIPGAEKRFKSHQEFAAPAPTLDSYAVGDLAGSVSIRRVSDDGELLRLPARGARGPAQPSYSPDGKFLCVAYGDGRWRIWNLANSTMVLEPRQSRGLQFTPDCKSIGIIEFTDGAPPRSRVVFYDPANGQSVRAISLGTFLSGHALDSLQFNPGGRSFALSSEDRTDILIVDVESGVTLMTLPHPDLLYRLAWHPDGRHLAAACHDNLIYIWDTVTGEKVRTLQGHQNTPISVLFSHDGTLLASSGWDGKTRLWDFQSGKQLLTASQSGFLTCFSADDRRLVLSNWEISNLMFFEVATGKAVGTIHERERGLGGPSGLAPFSRNGRLLAYQTGEGAKLWDAQASVEIRVATGADMSALGFDPPDENVLWQGPQGLYSWPIQGASTGPITVGRPVRLSVDVAGKSSFLSADGKLLGLLSGTGCEVFPLDSLTPQSRMEAEGDMWSRAFSPDGNLLAGGFRWHSGVKVWDTHSGRLIKELPTGDQIAAIVAFSPDGRRLVTATAASRGGEYRFWDVDAWFPGLRIAQPGNGWSSAMAFSADGKLFAGSHSVNVVRLYDARTGQALADIEPPRSWQVTGLSFNPDATLLAVCEGRDALHIWDLRYIRQQLARMGLDWNLPPYAPADSQSTAGGNRVHPTNER